MRTSTKIPVMVIAGVMAVLGLAGPTSASTPLESKIASEAKQAGLSTSEVAGLQKQIDALLAKTTGGEQIGVNQVSWRGGKTVMTFPLPGQKQARAINESVGTLGSPNCSKYYTCLYEHRDFGGRRLSWQDCAFHDLSDFNFNDKTSSYHNNQSNGTETKVANWQNPGAWFHLWTSVAPSSSSYVGDSKNDKADGIRVC